MWDEITANRGANEIASCIYKFVTTEMPPTVKKLYIVSDNCPGQNKNFIMQLFYLHLYHSRNLEVAHIFLKVGHTYMAADRQFAVIENAIKNSHKNFYTPDCYMDIIKNAKTKGPKYIVTKMSQEDFFDFEQLKKFSNKNPRKHPKEATFSEAAYFRVSKDFEYGYEYSMNYMQLKIDQGPIRNAPIGQTMRVAKGAPRKKDNSLANQQFKIGMAHFRPQKKYHNPLPLGAPKFHDLKSYVLDLVPNVHLRSYWDSIFQNENLHCNSVHNGEDDDLFFSDVCTDYD